MRDQSVAICGELMDSAFVTFCVGSFSTFPQHSDIGTLSELTWIKRDCVTMSAIKKFAFLQH